MTKNVLVSISGLQTDIDSSDTVEVISSGEYYFKNGKHFVLYEEASDENAVAMDTKCTLKLSANQIELMKKGDVVAHMIFEKGKPSLSTYSTSFGDIIVGTTTNSIHIEESESEIRAELLYSLEVNYNFVSECHLVVKISAMAGEQNGL